jgi:hypothetical protein
MGKTFSDVRTDFCDHLSTEQRRTLDAWEGRLIDLGCSKLHLGIALLPSDPSVEDYVLAGNYAWEWLLARGYRWPLVGTVVLSPEELCWHFHWIHLASRMPGRSRLDLIREALRAAGFHDVQITGTGRGSKRSKRDARRYLAKNIALHPDFAARFAIFRRAVPGDPLPGEDVTRRILTAQTDPYVPVPAPAPATSPSKAARLKNLSESRIWPLTFERTTRCLVTPTVKGRTILVVKSIYHFRDEAGQSVRWGPTESVAPLRGADGRKHPLIRGLLYLIPARQRLGGLGARLSRWACPWFRLEEQPAETQAAHGDPGRPCFQDPAVDAVEDARPWWRRPEAAAEATWPA